MCVCVNHIYCIYTNSFVSYLMSFPVLGIVGIIFFFFGRSGWLVGGGRSGSSAAPSIRYAPRLLPSYIDCSPGMVPQLWFTC